MDFTGDCIHRTEDRLSSQEFGSITGFAGSVTGDEGYTRVKIEDIIGFHLQGSFKL